jgi:hypothetical protein
MTLSKILLKSATVIGVALLAAGLATTSAQADDGIRAQNPNECRLFADIAIVARAMVEKRVDEAQQRPVLDAIYLPESKRDTTVISSILSAARRAEQPAADWASALVNHCLQKAGHLESFLGTSL